MTLVWMQHPDLPDQPIEVDELAVPRYAEAGWVLVPADIPADPPPAPSPAPVPEPDPAPVPATAARRRVQKEADEK